LVALQRDMEQTRQIEFSWTDERRLAAELTFDEKWTWEDLFVAQAKVNQAARQHGGPLDLVYNLSRTRMLPRQFFTQLKRVYGTIPAEVTLVIMVGCNPTIINLVRSVTRSDQEMAQRFAFVDTLEEAYYIIEPN